MEEILVVLDYRGDFYSKYNATPQYSGLDQDQFRSELEQFGYSPRFIRTTELDLSDPHSFKGKLVLYQGMEVHDHNSAYKFFLDDVLFFMKSHGARLIPEYQYFKAHSNKVYMELMRSQIQERNPIKTLVYGSLEDFRSHSWNWQFPVVVKKSHGAQSAGVYLAKNNRQLNRVIKKVSETETLLSEKVTNRLRQMKYKGYTPFSENRNKFIIQPMIVGLSGDYKILIFWNKFYVAERKNRPRDFRASGSGISRFTGDFEPPDGLLAYAFEIYKQFDVPYISLDIGVNAQGFHLIEFQFIAFGTSVYSKSKKYYVFRDGQFSLEDNILSIEFLFAYSIYKYLSIENPSRHKRLA